MKQIVYTPKEVAEMMGVSPRTIKRRCEAGDIVGAYRTSESKSGHWRIPESSMKDYFDKIGFEYK